MLVQKLNKPMACATRLLLLFIVIQLNRVAAYNSNDYAHAHGHGNTTDSFCHPDQAASLIQLKQSFIFDYSTTTLPSWQPGTDCCLWEGVDCDDDVPGRSHVTVLDLSGRGLYSYGCHAAVFNLTSLHYLDLSMNDFGRSRIPASGFERLSKLTYLNLSYSGFYGQIPIAIGKLTSLVTLDLSSLNNPAYYFKIPSYNALLGFYNYLLLQEPNFETLVSNLTNLRELYLDGVDISSSGEEWCSGLDKAFPSLRVLSMADCQLHGPLCSSISSLRSLSVLNLNHNTAVSGAIPEFLADFLNLSVLQLKGNSFSGWFPQTIFQLKNIRAVDVSDNSKLSGHLPQFLNGSSLETLYLHYTSFSGIKLNSFSNLLSLRELGFDGESISMDPTDLSFRKFDSLQILKLFTAPELGSFFSWITSLKNLTSLQLSDFRIMPSMIGNLTNLTSLEISYCGLVGQLPSSIGNLNKLTSLKIYDCDFSGTIPFSFGNLKKLRSLEISYTGLSGRIPSTIVNLTQLTYVDISDNDLTGEIPTSLLSSPIMLILDLSSNQLSGPMQELGGLTSLVHLDLSWNQLSGTIQELGGLMNLVDLDLSSNNLSGSVQLSSLWKLRKLSFLNLSNNKLFVLDGEGSKSTKPLLPKLSELILVSCNMIEIPRFLVHVNHITVLKLPYNKINGTIPQWIWDRWDHSLEVLNLSNNILTHMQLTSYVLPNTRLVIVDLSFNRLQGQIPIPNILKPVRNFLQVLDFSNNRFSSIVSNFTSYLSQISFLKLSRNNLSGPIPHSICDSSALIILDLSHNNFSGLIPSCLIEDNHLSILNLRENQFEGTLPYNVSKHCNLQTIDLHGNNIQGKLPRSLSNCAGLEIFDIGNNQMVDTFPSWLGRLSNLHVLVLRSNQFYGSLADPPRNNKFEEYFSKLQVIDIASNNFSGNLNPRWFEKLTYMSNKFSDSGSILQRASYGPYYYHNTISIIYKAQYVTFEKFLTDLTVIDFSNNALDGEIPGSIGRLVSLHILSMSRNAFTGRIPPQIGEMQQLESLDLSWNKLSGEIPQELTDLTFLGALNLGENKLEGKIPQLHQFATFENTSYEGNAGLCGPPLTRPCGSSSNPNEAQVNVPRDHVDTILFLFVGVGFGIGFTAGLLMKWGKIGKWFRIA